MNESTQAEARTDALELCTSTLQNNCQHVLSYGGASSDQCGVVLVPETGVSSTPPVHRYAAASASTLDAAASSASAIANRNFPKNTTFSTAIQHCDTLVANTDDHSHDFDFLSDPGFYRALIIAKLFHDIWTGIGLGLGFLIVLIAFAKRAKLSNWLIHGNLPYSLTVYGEDIQLLFKRTQRVNWYGRVVFGFVTNLSMTETQLAQVRKYWLGRTIAFDSLRRQRQNQLALLHLQRASEAGQPTAKSEGVWRQLFFCLRWIVATIFWLLRSAISFLIGFLFIRVTIAKLARGTVIESKNLSLILEARQAVEDTARQLKEYLTTAETFDGSDEVVDV